MDDLQDSGIASLHILDILNLPGYRARRWDSEDSVRAERDTTRPG